MGRGPVAPLVPVSEFTGFRFPLAVVVLAVRRHPRITLDLMEFHRHEFSPDYAVEIDPEFPGTGEWSEPAYIFTDPRVEKQHPFSGGDAPVILRTERFDGGSWIGKFASGDSGFSGVHACPHRDLICVIAGGTSYLVDSADPAGGALSPADQVWQALSSPDAGLLLLVTCIDITAVGAEGVLWTSGRLTLDNLRVDGFIGGQIHGFGTFPDLQERRIIIDSADGSAISEPHPGRPRASAGNLIVTAGRATRRPR